jgi:antitoxin CcdA
MRKSRSKPSFKKAVNIPSAVYGEAQPLDTGVSQACAPYQHETMPAEKEQRWSEEHADFIAAYNEMVEAEGLALQQWRGF